ncbi:Hypothetical protein ABZS17I87_00895 [Kosakonia cowanii]
MSSCCRLDKAQPPSGKQIALTYGITLPDGANAYPAYE